MKRLLLLFFTVTCLVSCVKTLSCDSAVDKWAKQNIEYYSTASRDEIVSLPLSRQQAIYRGLSAERKVELWQIKKELVYKSGSLSDAEYEDYVKLFNFMQPAHYESVNGIKILNAYAEKWMDIMVTKHFWGDEQLFEFSHIWMTKEEFTNAVLSDNILTKGVSLPGMEEEVICNCIYSIYCKTSGLGSICHDSPSCKDGDEGCGIVGSSNCKGTCQ